MFKVVSMLQNRKIAVIATIGFLILAGGLPAIADARLVLHSSPFKDYNTHSIENEKGTTCVALREYWAVLVGINNYPGSGTGLPYSLNEINSFKEILLNGGNWNSSQILVVTNSDATKAGVYDAIDWLRANVDENDTSIFFFVGHGGRNLTNEYIAVYDAPLYDCELDEQLTDVPGEMVVIIDACNSGGFIEELGKRGRIVLTACRKNESTYQVHDLKSGMFGYFLNMGLEWLTKNAEITFFFARLFTVLYSNRISEEYEEDYIVHPQMYDGTSGLTKLIWKHSYFKKFYYNVLFDISITNNEKNIWRM